MNNCCIDNDVIDVVGLCDISTLPDSDWWTQISIPENLVIPKQKPDIEQINSVKIDGVNIIRKKVIKTPVSAGNWEGKKLTGRKLIIEGEICQTVYYTALVKEQSVHAAHFRVPFSAYIVVPVAEADDPTKTFDVIPCVEDVYITSFCTRQIFKNITLFLEAISVPAQECCI